ncbi:unnamed protein product [Blepharisma stoltei]|uniref:Uncharacterized protein n=1 Tax=Blepharisma stoltei TaxID=1481888 RepID=A0AAU9IXM4_9CILI|nr:unnamed protein product [Blepharisma stoltei]
MKPFISIVFSLLLFPRFAVSDSNQDKYNNCVVNCKVTWSMLPYAETEYHIEKCIKDECDPLLQPVLITKDSQILANDLSLSGQKIMTEAYFYSILPFSIIFVFLFCIICNFFYKKIKLAQNQISTDEEFQTPYFILQI